MTTRLAWDQDGLDWPNRSASRFVETGGIRWHVQVLGNGPALLLVHGTGAATHSWRGLAPLLARYFTVIAPDLPGHGFTGKAKSGEASLPAMAGSLARLLEVLDVIPAVAAGHSAGAAILARMAIDGSIEPSWLVSLNGAWVPFRGAAAQWFSPAARLLASVPLVPRLFASFVGDRGAVERLIRDTGSMLDPQGIELYGRLLRNPAHVAGALTMMASWDLHSLHRDLPRLRTRLLLVTGRNDRTISPAEALRVRALVPGSEVVSLPGLGHLAHEERPGEVAALITRRVVPVCGIPA
jgi:magnesium chelatase accessory protein